MTPSTTSGRSPVEQLLTSIAETRVDGNGHEATAESAFKPRISNTTATPNNYRCMF
jgi:hypothetical protein